MTLARRLAALGLALASLAAVSPGDIAAHKARMDTAGDALLDLSDAIDTKDAARAAPILGQLQAITTDETAYWTAAGVAEGVRRSDANGRAIARILEHARQSDFVGAATALAEVQKDCRSCHDLHLEKAVHQGR